MPPARQPDVAPPERRTITLHNDLRTRTKSWHERVEETFEDFHLTTAEGLGAMVMAHIRVIDQVLDRAALPPVYRAELQRLRKIVGSLPTIVRSPPDDGRPPASSLHPFAIAYVILGSRLGARLIACRLGAGELAAPSDAVRFLTDEGSADAWRQLRLDLTAVSSTSEAETICADAESMFRLYYDTAKAMKPASLNGAA